MRMNERARQEQIEFEGAMCHGMVRGGIGGAAGEV